VRTGELKATDGPELWYLPSMRTTTTTHRVLSKSEIETLKVMADKTHMMFQLLPQLVNWLHAKDEQQRKFRSAVIGLLAKIESQVTMIHGAQIAEPHLRGRFDEEKMTKHVKETEEYISQQSQTLGLDMLKCIYKEEKKPATEVAHHDRRRKWHGWEI
jgi:regulator of replication initiation timing